VHIRNRKGLLFMLQQHQLASASAMLAAAQCPRDTRSTHTCEFAAPRCTGSERAGSACASPPKWLRSGSEAGDTVAARTSPAPRGSRARTSSRAEPLDSQGRADVDPLQSQIIPSVDKTVHSPRAFLARDPDPTHHPAHLCRKPIDRPTSRRAIEALSSRPIRLMFSS
jgi:hypothetical protein